MRTHRQKRIAHLVREQTCRARQPAFRNALAETLGVPTSDLEFLSLPKTDELLKTWRDGWTQADESGKFERFDLTDIQAATNSLRPLGDHLATSKVILLGNQSETVGAVRLSAACIFPRISHLLEFDGDDVCIVDSDEANGFDLELLEYDIELRLWGARWPQLTPQST